MTAVLAALRANRYAVFSGVGSLGGLYLVGLVLLDDFEVPAPVLALGLIVGMTYGILAVGLVLVYRTSKIVNFAHGEVGTFAGSLFGLWTASKAIGGFGLPYWLLLPVAMGVGAAASLGVEALAVRRLRAAPKVMSLVMTLGIATFLLLVALAVNTKIRNGSSYPKPPWLPTFRIGALTITPEYSAMLFLTPLLVIALGLFLSRTRVGVALRAAADNRDAAVMAAIPADRVSSLAWAIAGAVATFVAVMQFPQKGFVLTGAALGPGLLVRALLAAVVARLSSLPVAFLFGIVVGLIEQVTFWNTDSSGPAEVLLFATLLVVLLFQSRQGSRDADNENWIQVRPWGALPEELRGVPAIRLVGVGSLLVGAAFMLLAGLSTNRTSLAFTLVVAYSLVGLSIYVVTGMSGQLSLGQFAIAGVGAVVSFHVVEDVVRSLPIGMLAAGVVGAVVSVLVGLPALRIRGLLLAVTTLSFAVAAQAWLFSQSWAIGAGIEPSRLMVFGDRVNTARGYYLFSLPFLLGGLWLVGNVSRSGFGRCLRAVRDNEDAARGFGISATRKKLESFAFAGFLAGLGGALYAHSLPRLSIDTFTATNSISVVAITLIGGLSLLVGPLLGALYLLALPALVHLDEVGLAVSTLGWLVLLLYFPGGLAQAFKPTRDRVIAALARRAGVRASEAASPESVEQIERTAQAGLARVRDLVAPAAGGAGDGPLLQARGLSKSFGGVRAVHDVDLTVWKGETLGIIGANGAGKTTLFEMIAGFTRADAGRVEFDGRDVTDLPPEQRSRLGLVRSFQDARLFPTLTVVETVQLALERARPSRLWTALAAWPSEVEGEREKHDLARELLSAMGLDAFADKTTSELSTGTRRITELAAMAALRPRLLLLDEPSSGIAQRETEALGALLARLKQLLDTTFVVIEHDMPLMMGISDRIVAMEAGRVIAEGTPEEIRHDPLVVSSYLGGDLVAVERSGAGAGVVVAATAPSNGNGSHAGPRRRPTVRTTRRQS